MIDPQLSQGLPLPIAASVASLARAVTTDERFDASIAAMDSVIQMVASSALADYVHGHQRDFGIDVSLAGLRNPTLDEWMRILRQLCDFYEESRRSDGDTLTGRIFKFQRRPLWDDPPAAVASLFHLLKKALDQTIAPLEFIPLQDVFDAYGTYRARLQKRGAQVTDEQKERLSHALAKALVDVLQAYRLFQRYQLIYVQKTGGDGRTVPALDLVGPTPVADRPTLTLASGGVPVEGGKVYLHVAGHPPGFLSLYPFIDCDGQELYILESIAQSETQYRGIASRSTKTIPGRPSEIDVIKTSATASLGTWERDPNATQVDTESSPVNDFLVENFQIQRKLGAGAMGVVYEARQRSLNRNVALKVLPAEFSMDPKRIERFKREAYALAAVNHPNIVTIHDITQCGGQSLICMEYIEGQDLAQRIREAGRLEPQEVVEMGLQLCNALKVLHEHKIVHRDIKPSNAMITTSRVVKLLDFGLAKPFESSTLMTRPGGIVGTPAYMSPEQRAGRNLDFRTDIYSLGVCLYEALTGDLPDHGEQAPEPPHRIVPDLRMHKELSKVVMRAMARDPEDRFDSADEFARALQRSLHGGSKKGVWFAAAVVLVAGVAGAFAFRGELSSLWGGSPSRQGDERSRDDGEDRRRGQNGNEDENTVPRPPRPTPPLARLRDGRWLAGGAALVDRSGERRVSTNQESLQFELPALVATADVTWTYHVTLDPGTASGEPLRGARLTPRAVDDDGRPVVRFDVSDVRPGWNTLWVALQDVESPAVPYRIELDRTAPQLVDLAPAVASDARVARDGTRITIETDLASVTLTGAVDDPAAEIAWLSGDPIPSSANGGRRTFQVESGGLERGTPRSRSFRIVDPAGNEVTLDLTFLRAGNPTTEPLRITTRHLRRQGRIVTLADALAVETRWTNASAAHRWAAVPIGESGERGTAIRANVDGDRLAIELPLPTPGAHRFRMEVQDATGQPLPDVPREDLLVTRLPAPDIAIEPEGRTVPHPSGSGVWVANATPWFTLVANDAFFLTQELVVTCGRETLTQFAEVPDRPLARRFQVRLQDEQNPLRLALRIPDLLAAPHERSYGTIHNHPRVEVQALQFREGQALVQLGGATFTRAEEVVVEAGLPLPDAGLAPRELVVEVVRDAVKLQEIPATWRDGSVEARVPLQADGTYAFKIRGRDAFGADVGSSASIGLHRKRTAPTVHLPESLGSVVEAWVLTDVVLRGIEVRDEPRWKDLLAGGRTWSATLDDRPLPAAGTGQELALTLGRVRSVLQLRARDALGNESEPRTIALELKVPSPLRAEDGPQGIVLRNDPAKDGAELVFCSTGPAPALGEKPRGFFIYRHEVSQGMYAMFMAAGGYDTQAYWTDEGWARKRAQQWQRPQGAFDPQSDHPVVGISVVEASAYARWAGMELPTVTEWTAALGDTLRADPQPLARGKANIQSNAFVSVKENVAGASPIGCLNLLGNAEEWCLKASERSGAPMQGPYYSLGGSCETPKGDFTEGAGYRIPELRTDSAVRRSTVTTVRPILRMP